MSNLYSHAWGPVGVPHIELLGAKGATLRYGGKGGGGVIVVGIAH